jgi:hypothetical protein
MVLGLLQSGLETGGDVRPRAVVERLFLDPLDFCVGILVEVRGELLER